MGAQKNCILSAGKPPCPQNSSFFGGGYFGVFLGGESASVQKYRDISGIRIVIQIGGAYNTTFCQEEAYFFKSIASERGGVLQHSSKYRG